MRAACASVVSGRFSAVSGCLPRVPRALPLQRRSIGNPTEAGNHPAEVPEMKPKRIAVLLVPLATVAALTVAAGQPSQASQVSQSSQSSQSSGGIPNVYGAGPWVLRNRASNLCLSLLPQNSSKGIQVV